MAFAFNKITPIAKLLKSCDSHSLVKINYSYSLNYKQLNGWSVEWPNSEIQALEQKRNM